MNNREETRDSTLDVLRGGAMLYIVGFWHIDDYTTALSLKNSYSMFLTICILGLFTFLSGMLLSRRYSFKSFSDVRRFYLRRIQRIYILYVIALFGFLACNISSKGQLLKGLLGVNLFLGTGIRKLWFVEMVLFFYLITPLFLFNYTVRKTLLLSIGFSCVLGIAHHFSNGTVNQKLAQFVLIYAIGLIAGRSECIMGLFKGGLIAGCCLFFLPFIWWLDSKVSGVTAVLISQISMLVFLPFAFFSARFLAKWVSPKLISNIAYVSFSMYLFHRITGHMARSLYLPTSIMPSLLYLYGFFLPFTYLSSWVFQKGYDHMSGAIIQSLRADEYNQKIS